jgi:tRNA (guanine-N7-)-methyltransferase
VKETENNSPPLEHRSIRSFVVRGGRATAGQQRGLAELFPVYGIPAIDPAKDLSFGGPAAHRIDFDSVFGKPAPRMIEIGFGAGEALLDFAQHHPEMNCLGVEVHPPGIGHLLLGVEEAKLTNVRVVAQDAVEVLRDRIAPASIDLIHVFFPDPWPKKRHHKRRLIQPAFAQLLTGVLRTGGVLRLATDWEHYAHHMREVLDATAQLRNLSCSDGFMQRESSRVLTRFERRGQRLGHGVWDLAYEKL